MALLEIVLPVLFLAAAGAAVSLVVASRREVPELVREAEVRFDRHRRAHPVRHRTALSRHKTATSRHVRIK